VLHKYRHTGLVEGERRGPGRSRGVLFPPFLSLLRQLRRAPTRGQATRAIHFTSSLPDAAGTPPPSLNPSFPLPGPGSSYLRSMIYPSFELFAARGLLRAYSDVNLYSNAIGQPR